MKKESANSVQTCFLESVSLKKKLLDGTRFWKAIRISVAVRFQSIFVRGRDDLMSSFLHSALHSFFSILIYEQPVSLLISQSIDLCMNWRVMLGRDPNRKRLFSEMRWVREDVFCWLFSPSLARCRWRRRRLDNDEEESMEVRIICCYVIVLVPFDSRCRRSDWVSNQSSMRIIFTRVGGWRRRLKRPSNVQEKKLRQYSRLRR